LRLVENGKDPPEAYFTEPAIEESNVFYWEAFYELSTERQIGMGIGPIPRSAVMAYAAEWGLVGDAVEHFANIIKLVDVEQMRISNSMSSSSDKKGAEADISDVEGTKTVLNKLVSRANRSKSGKP